MQVKRTDATAHNADARQHARPHTVASDQGSGFGNRLLTRAARFAPMLALVALTGCTAALDAKIAQAQADYRGAVRTASGAATIFADGYDDLASKKHELQSTGIARDWQTWLDRHTSDDGRLVSRDESGKIVPMLASDLNAAITLREEANLKLALSRESNAKFSQTFRTAFAKLDATTTLLDEKSVEWDRAKAEAREAQNALFSAVAAAAAALAAGGL